jgi:hypothetical protein
VWNPSVLLGNGRRRRRSSGGTGSPGLHTGGLCERRHDPEERATAGLRPAPGEAP